MSNAPVETLRADEVAAIRRQIAETSCADVAAKMKIHKQTVFRAAGEFPVHRMTVAVIRAYLSEHP